MVILKYNSLGFFYDQIVLVLLLEIVLKIIFTKSILTTKVRLVTTKPNSLGLNQKFSIHL